MILSTYDIKSRIKTKHLIKCLHRYLSIIAKVDTQQLTQLQIIFLIEQFIKNTLFEQQDLYDSQMVDEVLKFLIHFTTGMFNQLYQGLPFDINLLGLKIIQTLIFNRTKVQEHYFKQLKEPTSILQIDKIQQSKTPEDLFEEIRQYFNFNNYSQAVALEQIQQYPQKLHLKCQLYIILQFKIEPPQEIAYIKDLYDIVIKYDPITIQNSEKILQIIDCQLKDFQKYDVPEIQAFKIEIQKSNINVSLLSDVGLSSDIFQTQIVYHVQNQQIYKYKFQQLMEDVRENRIKLLKLNDPLQEKLNEILVQTYQDNRHPVKFVISKFIIEQLSNCYENVDYKVNLLNFILRISYKIMELSIIKDLRAFKLKDGELKIIIYHIVQIIIFNFQAVRKIVDLEDEEHQIIAPIEMFYYMLDLFEDCLGSDNKVKDITFKYHLMTNDEKYKLKLYQQLINQWLPLDIFDLQKITDYKFIQDSIIRYKDIH